MSSLAKYITITVVVFVILSGFACSFYSFTQVENHEQKGNGTTSVINKDFCNGKSAMLPTKFTFKDDDKHVIACKWATHNQGVRISYTLGGAIFSIITLVFIFKRRKLVFMIFALIVLAIGGCGVYSFIIDANAVYKSRKWCKAGMEGVYLTGIECLYTPFIVTVMLNVLSSVLMIISSILVIRFRKVVEGDGHHHHHHQHSSGDGFYEESAPLVGEH
ncbi:hypothetical protein PPL_04420 [Heterostelium album PN500]|uniref:Uncharacterized protein n=1 Tax=Heterostelium pallidum (strain ATCC 26659 / Pp 5 / PN500) TaxID=670386 RepID=D3B7I2_HETP5|nr:hypothetical protein PPL_04420 [Heterostelium album PN500]EFA82725.1 hypothetical protein PPL_04420 [Heterostelium album PN500]|eukprot:XP_020434842.1 hypothetical protein PPL_04420 [Heterostelium album PN500]